MKTLLSVFILFALVTNLASGKSLTCKKEQVTWTAEMGGEAPRVLVVDHRLLNQAFKAVLTEQIDIGDFGFLWGCRKNLSSKSLLESSLVLDCTLNRYSASNFLKVGSEEPILTCMNQETSGAMGTRILIVADQTSQELLWIIRYSGICSSSGKVFESYLERRFSFSECSYASDS